MNYQFKIGPFTTDGLLNKLYPLFLKDYSDRIANRVSTERNEYFISTLKYFLEKETDHGLLTRLKKGLYALKTDYPCEEEIAEICHHLKISNCFDIIKADSVGFREQEIKNFFYLS